MRPNTSYICRKCQNLENRKIVEKSDKNRKVSNFWIYECYLAFSFIGGLIFAACFCRHDYNSIEHQAKNWRMCANYSSVEYDSTKAEDGWAGQ